ncbi:MAG: carbohydrate kinase [Solobacterium sp.]|nr:carbohydrate kinase [Solobacterium sp.]
MTMSFDVVALGELLIDFTENGMSEQGNPLLEANPGGAPCNVLSMLTRYGRKVAFIGKVGNDGFGNLLEQAIVEQGISAEGLKKDNDVHTTLSLVLKKPNGDRDFAFYRKPGADVNLKPEEIDPALIENSRLFHFGTLSLTDEPAISATYRAIEIAEKAGLIRSFDPNLREPLWPSLDEAWKAVDWGMQHTDILKISDNEIQWFTGKEDFDEGIKVLQDKYPNLKLICLSMGPDGSRAYWNGLRVEVPAFLQEKTIETTGAGDTFCASMIHHTLKYGLDGFDEDKLKEMLTMGNASASIVTTRKGALRVMPQIEEVKAFIAERTA